MTIFRSLFVHGIITFEEKKDELTTTTTDQSSKIYIELSEFTIQSQKYFYTSAGQQDHKNNFRGVINLAKPCCVLQTPGFSLVEPIKIKSFTIQAEKQQKHQTEYMQKKVFLKPKLN